MCLAIPGQVLSIQGGDPLLLSGRVSFAGAIKEISLTCVPEVKVGDYVLVHVGLALSIVDAEEAATTFRYLREMGDLDGLDVGPPP